MHTPKSLTGHEPRVFAERVMRVDSVLLGSRELSHSRVWFKLDHLGPSCLGEEKPASVAASEARIRCGRRSPQVKPASVAAEPASIAAGKARIRAAGEARIRCGISLTHNGSPKVYVRYYKNDVYI